MTLDTFVAQGDSNAMCGKEMEGGVCGGALQWSYDILGGQILIKGINTALQAKANT